MLTNEVVATLYARKVDGEKVKDLAQEAGVTTQALAAAFKKLSAQPAEMTEVESEDRPTVDGVLVSEGEAMPDEMDLDGSLPEAEPAEEEAPASSLPEAEPMEPGDYTNDQEPVAVAVLKAKKKGRKKSGAAAQLTEQLGEEKIAELGKRWQAGEKLMKLAEETQPHGANTLFWVLVKAGYNGSK